MLSASISIYRDHPEIGAVITAQCPSATAYSITGRKLDTRTIPESYIVLRDIPRSHMVSNSAMAPPFPRGSPTASR